MRKTNQTKKPLALVAHTIKTLDSLQGVAGGDLTLQCPVTQGASCNITWNRGCRM